MSVESDKTNTGVVATIVAVGVFAMITISALVTAMVRSEQAELDVVRPEHADLDTVAALKKEQFEVLRQAPHWADRAAGKVAIPVERAMRLVLDEYRKDPLAASPPVPPGLVLPPDPTVGATGAESGNSPTGAVVASAPGSGSSAAPKPAGTAGK